MFTAWLFELAGGAITDFENTCVPKSQREASFTIAALHQWEMDVDDDRCVESAEEVGPIQEVLIFFALANIVHKWISETLSCVATGGPFPSVSAWRYVLPYGSVFHPLVLGPS